MILPGLPYKKVPLKILCLVLLLIFLFTVPIHGVSENSSGDNQRLSVFHALVLGLVEGVTEYLPVSSTGHLLLTQHLMGLDDTQGKKDAADSYAVVIQIGAILAVLGLYRRRSMLILQGFLGKSPEGLKLGGMLILAFLPAAITGLLFSSLIKQVLFGPWAVAMGWIFGGVAIFFAPTDSEKHHPGPLKSIEDMSWRVALVIGLFQVAAMWPGVSRSLATIMGGLFAGLSLGAAVEFSFLLGLITLGAATVYEFAGHGAGIVSAYGIFTPVMGIFSAFIAAWFSVKWLVNYLKKHGLRIFGYYRILLGIVTIILLITHVI
ncbi:MAG: undecaprenyl-diphosphate phosphatase [Desulfobacteraceae bacterium]|nr:undecaprenyl-diphosphate phosphatase [Desulfobacteraceae bacterium]